MIKPSSISHPKVVQLYPEAKAHQGQVCGRIGMSFGGSVRGGHDPRSGFRRPAASGGDKGESGSTAAMLKQARASGVLNMSGRSLKAVPQEVWRINLDAGKGQVIDMSAKCTDNWYDQNELTKLFVASNALESIPDDITNLPALVFLDAHDNIINDVTDRICECMELKTVNLGHNKLSKIPYGMCDLANLQVLRLEHNQLVELPEAVSRWSMLTELDISDNALSTLPDGIGNLSQVRKLNIARNRLHELPSSFGTYMDSVEDLDLSSNKLAVLPRGMRALRALVRLDLRYNVLVTAPDLSNAARLKEILLGYNRLSDMGDGTTLPVTLQILDMRDNKVSSLPAAMCTRLEQLERLDVTNNDLNVLPAELGLLRALKSIVLDGNPIRSIRRDVIARGSLAIKEHLRSKLSVDATAASDGTIDASRYNQQQRARDHAHAVKTTNVFAFSGKKVVEVPADAWAVAEGTPVTSVVLSKNMLTAVPTPVWQFAATLTALDMSHNKLGALPVDVACLRVLVEWVPTPEMQSIDSKSVLPCELARRTQTKLDLRFNGLSTLPLQLQELTQLQEVLLSGNRFTQVPNVLYMIKSITAIVAADNQINFIDADGLAALPGISCLDLTNNNIAKVPPELGFIDTIQKLELHGNTFRTPRPAILAKGTPALMEWLRGRLSA